MGTPYMTPTPLASPGQLAAEHAVYADFMRTVLEIINTIITTGGSGHACGQLVRNIDALVLGLFVLLAFNL